MKTKISARTIQAYYTTDPERIARLINEADSVNMPEKLYKEAADLAATIQANVRKNDLYEGIATVAAYMLKYAYILNKAGELVDAPPKPKRQKKTE